MYGIIFLRYSSLFREILYRPTWEKSAEFFEWKINFNLILRTKLIFVVLKPVFTNIKKWTNLVFIVYYFSHKLHYGADSIKFTKIRKVIIIIRTFSNHRENAWTIPNPYNNNKHLCPIVYRTDSWHHYTALFYDTTCFSVYLIYECSIKIYYFVFQIIFHLFKHNN